MKEIPQNVSEAFKRLNPHLYGVRAVETSQPKPTAAQALDGNGKKFKDGKGRVAICVSFVVLSRRPLDSDNLQGALKPARDAVAESLGLDDGDKRITWEYGWAKTSGRQGVLVKIEAI